MPAQMCEKDKALSPRSIECRGIKRSKMGLLGHVSVNISSECT